MDPARSRRLESICCQQSRPLIGTLAIRHDEPAYKLFLVSEELHSDASMKFSMILDQNHCNGIRISAASVPAIDFKLCQLQHLRYLPYSVVCWNLQILFKKSLGISAL